MDVRPTILIQEVIMNGGLNLKGMPGIGATAEEDVHNKWSSFESVEAELSYMGFPPVEKPPYSCPNLTPEMLTEATDKQYTAIFVQLGEWYGYVTNVHARIKAILIQIDNELGDLESRLREGTVQASKIEGRKKPTLQEIADTIKKDPRILELTLQKQHHEQKKLLLQSYVGQLERNLKIVSRQVEIRRQDLEHHQVANNMPTRGIRRP